MEHTKRILVASLQNVPHVEAFFRGYVLKVMTGSRYLRGFFGKASAQDKWLEVKVEG